MRRILQATRFAADKHADQRRKNAAATPYINHPVEVAELLAVVGRVDDEEMLIAALLHDTIEDTDTTRDEIRERFGDAVLELVLELTDDKSLPKAERKRQQVVQAPQKSLRARQIKIADKITNLTSLYEDPPVGWGLDRQQQYFDWALAVFEGLRGINERLDAEFLRIHGLGVERLRKLRGEEPRT